MKEICLDALAWVFLQCYIPAEVAKMANFTHHGRMFGLPAWVAETEEGWDAVPKCQLLLPWVLMADFAYNVFAYFMPSDQYIVTPIKKFGKID